MQVRRILVLERTKVLGTYLEEYFSQQGIQYAVLAATSAPDALEILETQSVDLMVADHEGLDGINGLDILRWLKEAEITVRVVLLSDPQREADRNLALTLGCTAFLLRPVPEAKLGELVYNLVQPHQGYTGRVVGLKLDDVIQMFCYRKDTTRLTVFKGDSVGNIYVHEGGIIHAQCDSLSGVDAFFEILGWESGEFLSQVTFRVPDRTMFQDWQSLLMEGTRQKDEIRHALGPIPDTGVSSAYLTVVPPVEPLEETKRVMIVDDSRFIRKIVQEIIQSDPQLIVAGFAANGQEALAKIAELKPDLILLDWDMPVMKGSTTLMHIMIRSPCPVVILSSFVGGLGANPFDLLSLGGVDFLRKPQSNWRMNGRADDLVRRVREAASIKFDRIRRIRMPAAVKEEIQSPVPHVPPRFLAVFASSIGGCADLIRVIPFLREDVPAAIVVLHDMQLEAILAFVEYLDRRSRIPVRLLQSGAPLTQGVCYLHPATIPLELTRDGADIRAKVLSELPGGNTADHFLISASKVMGKNLLAILLSGRSDGGVIGCRAVKQVEGVTMVLDPASSVDPRMAIAALQDGIVDYTCSADQLAETFQKLIR